MPNTIIVKRSSVAGKVPLSTDLQVGELAVNLADQKIYSKNAAGTVVQLGGGSGSGDVVGPASATDNALARFDGTTGKLIQNSLGILDDSGNLDVTSAKADYFDLDTAAAAPASAVGREAWDDGAGAPIVGLKGGNVTYYYGQQEFARVFNGSGAAMTKGQVVYIVGAQGNRIDVRLARADVEATSANTIGFVAESIAANAEGWVQTAGPLPQINTSTLTAGQTLYLSPTTAGAYTTTKPVAPNQLVILGFVERVHATVGSIYVKVNNGYELDELHDVLITSPASGNTLIYDAATAVWKNANLTAGTGISVTNGAGSITIANTGVTSVTGTSPVSSSGGATPAISLASGYGDTQNPYASKTANNFLAAPNGTAGVPTFRAIVAADIPTLNQNTTGTAANVTGTVAVANGGTGQTTYTNGQLLIGNTTGGTLNKATLTQGTGITITNGAGSITIANSAPDQTVALTGSGATTVTGTYPNFTISSVNTTYSAATSTVAGLIELGSDTVQTVAANAVSATASRTYALQVNAAGQGVVNVPWTDTNSGGTVTSVGGTGTVSGLTLSGTVTTSGNLTLGGTLSVTPSNFASQTANTVLAAPNGVAGTPTFRALVAADIPTLNQNTTGTASNVTGTVAIANGGTGQTTQQAALNALAGAVTSGSYLRGNGTNVVMSAIQAADVPTLNQNTTGSAAKWTTARTLSFTGDVTGSGSVDGSANVATAMTLANSGATAGTYNNVTVNAKGLVTAGSNVAYLTQAFPSGTAMLFVQTAAPTGWTKSTTHNDKALRVVSGTASSGGTVAFTTAFSSSRATSTVSISASVDGTTLSTTQMPSHRHSIREEYGVAGQAGYPPNDTYNQIAGNNAGTKSWQGDPISFEGGSGSHNHGFSQSGHSHVTDLAVQYVDVIIATKD